MITVIGPLSARLDVHTYEVACNIIARKKSEPSKSYPAPKKVGSLAIHIDYFNLSCAKGVPKHTIFVLGERT